MDKESWIVRIIDFVWDIMKSLCCEISIVVNEVFGEIYFFIVLFFYIF